MKNIKSILALGVLSFATIGLASCSMSAEYTYGDPLWTWASDYSWATATFASTNGEDTQTLSATVTSEPTAATCTEDGITVYTATVTFNDEIYTDTQTVTTEEATGHSYTALTYSDGYWYETCTVDNYVSTTAYEGTDYSGYTFLADSTASAASAIALNATNIQLTADVTVSIGDLVLTTFTEDNTATVDMTIDVAGHTLTVGDYYGQYASLVLYNGQKLTITDSKYDSASETPGLVLANIAESTPSQSSVAPFTNSKFTLDSIYATSNGCAIFPRGDAAEANIINSKVVTTGNYVVGTNAATVDNYNVVITIDDSYLEAQAVSSAVVCINVAGTLNISDSTIVGSKIGVMVRAGTATITNTNIACTMNESEIDDTMISYTTDPSSWGSGTAVAMGAVVVGNNTASTYAANATVTITDCNLSYTIVDDDTTNDVDYSNFAIALYLARLTNTTYQTSVTLSGTNSLTGNVINICGEGCTSTLTGYDGTVYDGYDSGWTSSSTAPAE